MEKTLLVLIMLTVVLALVACGGECNHDYVTLEIVNPTCSEGGYTVYECSKCKDRTQGDYLDTTEHNYELSHHELPLYNARATYTCTYCNSWYEEDHQVEQAVTVEPTCTEVGYTIYSCSCGYTVNADYGSYYAEHQYEEEIVIPSTCTERGETIYTCSCGETLIVDEPLKPHTEEIVEGMAATCTETGLTDGKKCSVCNVILIEQKEIPVAAHTYDDIYDADCNECGFTRDPACRHSDVEIVKGYNSTCTATGLTDGSKCVKCGEIIISQEVIDLKPHTEVIDARVEATCTLTGLTEGKHCSVCETILIPQFFIPKKSHSYSDWIVDKEATVTEDGSRHKLCGICGDEQSEILYATGSVGLEYKKYTNGYAVIGLGTCTNTEIIIPERYNGLPVVSVGEYVFKGTNIKSITIGKNVQSISDTSQCSTLTEIKVDINNQFYMDIEGVLYSKSGRDLYAYPVGRTDTSFEIPYGVTHIYGFERCRNLTRIVIPDSVVSIDGFLWCTGITSIGPVGSGASVEIPESVRAIGREAFAYCCNLKNATIPASVETIGEYAFVDCSSLAFVEFVDNSSLISISEGAFANCLSLSNIVIPELVTTIGDMAFSACYSLIEVCNKSALNIEAGSRAFGDIGYYAKKIINDESQSAIKYISDFGAGDYIFYDDGTEIYLVKYLSNDLRVTLIEYDGGKEYGIWHHAFYHYVQTPFGYVAHMKMISINIPDDITEIGTMAFQDCYELSAITFAGTVEQWNAIVKADGWCPKNHKIEVFCYDGIVTYN